MNQPIHFIGIGGAGMSAIARLFLARGHAVTGSDSKDSATVELLRSLGAVVWIGHDAGHVASAGTVVYSTAIKADNPELLAATQAGTTLWHRSQALAAAMAGSDVITVAGTHGKTTTSSMTAVALAGGGIDPSFAIGANVPELGAAAGLGTSRYFVAEADESDGSFLNYSPAIIVLTNVEPDHLDHYGTAEAVREAFASFLDLLPEGGFLVACADDAGAKELALQVRQERAQVLLYGEDRDADLVLTGSGPGEWELADPRGETWALRLSVPGAHNAANAAAAFAVARYLGADLPGVLDALAGFHGASRRFEFKGEAAGIRIYDDYAHHPTEVRAALSAARSVAGTGRVLALFQPHLYSRTAAFAADFGHALALADAAWVLPIFAAREDPLPGVTSALVADVEPTVTAVSSVEQAISSLAAAAQPGDVLLTIGAGDVTAIGPKLLAELAEPKPTHGGNR